MFEILTDYFCDRGCQRTMRYQSSLMCKDSDFVVINVFTAVYIQFLYASVNTIFLYVSGY